MSAPSAAFERVLSEYRQRLPLAPRLSRIAQSEGSGLP
jgi:hypothetical protein